MLHACSVWFHPPAGATGSTVRVEVLRLPPLTLFALEDNQSSASPGGSERSTHLLGNAREQPAPSLLCALACHLGPFDQVGGLIRDGTRGRRSS
jgi:hypothetical protein